MHAVPSWELVGSHEAATGAEPVALPVVSEFALTFNNPPRQLEIRHGNPLCLLASRTRAGIGVCNEGCGICRSAVGMLHTCPFGLEMQCAGVTGSEARWVGRRFSSARSMHKALELLEMNGIDREEILAHLPDEPVVPRSKFQTKSPTARSVAPQAAAIHDERAGHLLEYVEQVHRLIASPGKREEVCNRFLRALCGAVPFDEMAIYLADADGLVLAAAADRDDKARPRPRAHPCKPPKEGLVGQAAARSCTMVQNAGGSMEPFIANADQPQAVAIPLAGKGLRPIGVWLASCGGAVSNSPIQLQPMRLMHLLADMLAERLDREDRAAAPGVEVVAIEDPNHKLMAELRSEVARATRLESSFALLRVVVDPGRAKIRLPAESLGEALVGAVRPYDRVRPVHGEPCAWWVMGAHAGGDDARAIGARLVATLEDVMDAHGGAEELGISFRVGISVWGDDAASADEMVAHATAAAAEADMDSISQFRPPCLVMDDHG